MCLITDVYIYVPTYMPGFDKNTVACDESIVPSSRLRQPICPHLSAADLVCIYECEWIASGMLNIPAILKENIPEANPDLRMTREKESCTQKEEDSEQCIPDCLHLLTPRAQYMHMNRYAHIERYTHIHIYTYTCAFLALSTYVTLLFSNREKA